MEYRRHMGDGLPLDLHLHACQSQFGVGISTPPASPSRSMDLHDASCRVDSRSSDSSWQRYAGSQVGSLKRSLLFGLTSVERLEPRSFDFISRSRSFLKSAWSTLILRRRCPFRTNTSLAPLLGFQCRPSDSSEAMSTRTPPMFRGLLFDSHNQIQVQYNVLQARG